MINPAVDPTQSASNQSSGTQPIAAADGTILAVRGLVKSYHKNRIEVPVLRGVDFDIEVGSMTSLVGRSGSGKSTLMHLMATLDQPDAGEVSFEGSRIDNASARQRDFYRNHQIGMIFQFYHLLPELTALENVMVPTMISRRLFSFLRVKKTARQRAEQLLEMVGLTHRTHHRPSEMSGGEMQRAAIARALMNNPTLLLADEPTGNLDSETGHGILELLRKLNDENNLTIVMITHDDAIARQADRMVRLENGLVVDQGEAFRVIR
ncbi:ABC transporter ATP-binding protein [Rosistilla oblonga]|uniref:P-loop containing nucleoside triphosphate hydrolase n=1 Tax=Rosistilla oblonga TaxID=2527990 RepID=A0A518IYN3_9BACT|nr:ABC transporter ATP-binding protein [Rosistilla oblonga]QDV58203.1 P-loop containing nucleoside triphosphate hydrolase [Rosistilla oblonga]